MTAWLDSPLLAMAEIPGWLHFTRDIAAAGMELTNALQEDPVLH